MKDENSNENKKPVHIEHQENHNCNQFFGNIYGGVFPMPGATVNYNPTIAPQPETKTDEAEAAAAQPQGVEAVRPLLDAVVDAEDERKRKQLKKTIDAVLKDKMFAEAFMTVAPRGFKGGYNQKLLLNLLGFMHDRGVCSLSYNAIKPIVSPEKDVKTYFTYCCDEKSGMTDEMQEKLDELIG